MEFKTKYSNDIYTFLNTFWFNGEFKVKGYYSYYDSFSFKTFNHDDIIFLL